MHNTIGWKIRWKEKKNKRLKERKRIFCAIKYDNRMKINIKLIFTARGVGCILE